MTMESIFEKIGGRKLVACLIALVAAIVFFALQKMSEPGFLDLVKWALIVYIGGNVTTDVATMFKKPAPPAPPAP